MIAWTAVGTSAQAGSESISVSDFLMELTRLRDSLIPFVGAGLAIDAGAPSSMALIEALVTAAGEPYQADMDFFATADRLASDLGEEWIQRHVAEIVGRATVVPTPALMALAKTASGLIITTNYDEAIEVSAREIGIPVVSTTLRDFRPALEPPEDALVVVHLHGVTSQPDSIVLTEASYQRILTDEAAQLVLRARGISGRLLFVGHSLAERERHIRRDVAWTMTAGVPAGEQRHLLVMSVPAVGSRSTAMHAEALVELGLRVFVFDDPTRKFEAVRLAAMVIAGPSAVADEDLAEPMGPDDKHYLSHEVAPAEDLVDAAARGGYIARTWQYGAEMASDLDVRENRLLLVAGGGYGKSRELREIARRSDRPSLYLRLGGVETPRVGVTPDQTFVRWMDKAAAAQENPSSRLTVTSLREDSFVLLLDGLDEVPADLRPTVVDLINGLVSAYPQHRWVVASRPVPELDGLAGFSRYGFAPGSGWINRYAERRSVPSETVDQFLGGAPGIGDLMDIPVFAISVVDELAAGHEPPRTALDLVLALADARVRSDRRPLADPAGITAWLDRVALALELRGATEIDLDALVVSGLHLDLDIAATRQLVDDLAVRSLVTDTANTVRFPANIVQEARAARVVLSSGERGKDLLRAHVLVRLPVVGPDGSSVSGVRPSWVNTLEMLLGATDEGWRSVVAEYDPMLAARATPADATEAERHRAVETLWNTYVRRCVWLSRGNDSADRDDAGALRRLVAGGAPPGFVDALRAALGDSERTIRANALAILAVALPDVEMSALVRNAITDADPVVRRQAAAAALERGFTELSDVLAAQAAIDLDEMARQTLSDFAITLAASDERAIELAKDAPPEHAQRAWREVARRVPRAQLLGLVAGPPPDSALLDVLLDDGVLHRAPWTADEVYRLAETLTRLPDDFAHMAGVEAVLGSQPLAALAGRLVGPPSDYLSFDVERFSHGWDLEELRRVVDLLGGDGSAIGRAAGVSSTSPPEVNTLAAIRDYLSAAVRFAADPPLASTRQARPNPQLERAQAAAAGEVTIEDLDVLLSMGPASLESALDPEQLERLTARAQEELSRLVSSRELEMLAGSTRIGVPARTIQVLHWAAYRDLPIDQEHWPSLALLALRWRDDSLTRWCRDKCTSASISALMDQLRGTEATLIAAAHSVVPKPWASSFVHIVLDATLILASSTEPDGPSQAAATVASLIEGGAPDIVRSWLPSPCPSWLLPLAVTVGDCKAEEVLLTGLLADPDAIPRWPLRRATDWLAGVRCPSSADVVVEVLRATLIRGRETHDLRALFSALDRIEGVNVLGRYDSLIEDRQIPGAAFLHYERQRALAALLESGAQATLGTPEAADRAVRGLTAESQAESNS